MKSEAPAAPSGLAFHRPSPALGEERLVRIADIVRDAGTQVRVQGLVEERVLRYVEKFEAGEEPPPLLVRQEPDGLKRLLLGDGAHRLAAGERVGKTHLRAIVKPGGVLDAYRDGLAGNGGHGLDLSDQDRLAALRFLLQTKEHKDGLLSQKQIAKDLGYSEARVSQVAAQLREAGSMVKPLTITGQDGRTKPRANLGARRDLPSAPPPARPAPARDKTPPPARPDPGPAASSPRMASAPKGGDAAPPRAAAIPRTALAAVATAKEQVQEALRVINTAPEGMHRTIGSKGALRALTYLSKLEEALGDWGRSSK